MSKKYTVISKDKNTWTTIYGGPCSIIVLTSGWGDKERYHIIIEDPECGDYHYEHYMMTKKEFDEKFPHIQLE